MMCKDKLEIRSHLADIINKYPDERIAAGEQLKKQMDNNIVKEMTKPIPECNHPNAELVHKFDCFPYGDDVEYKECVDCGTKFSFRMLNVDNTPY